MPLPTGTGTIMSEEHSGADHSLFVESAECRVRVVCVSSDRERCTKEGYMMLQARTRGMCERMQSRTTLDSAWTGEIEI